jgi:hypothetical protein
MCQCDPCATEEIAGFESKQSYPLPWSVPPER